MDAGVAAEYDAPDALLGNAGGIFTSMVNETGKATAAYLRSIAAGTADPGSARGDGAPPSVDGSAAAAVSRTVSAVEYPPLSRSGSEAQNGLLVAQKVLREAAEADHLLSHLVHYMEDKVRLALACRVVSTRTFEKCQFRAVVYPNPYPAACDAGPACACPLLSTPQAYPTCL